VLFQAALSTSFLTRNISRLNLFVRKLLRIIRNRQSRSPSSGERPNFIEIPAFLKGQLDSAPLEK
jgi:hypothetical protein